MALAGTVYVVVVTCGAFGPCLGLVGYLGLVAVAWWACLAVCKRAFGHDRCQLRTCFRVVEAAGLTAIVLPLLATLVQLCGGPEAAP